MYRPITIIVPVPLYTNEELKDRFLHIKVIIYTLHSIYTVLLSDIISRLRIVTMYVTIGLHAKRQWFSHCLQTKG